MEFDATRTSGIEYTVVFHAEKERLSLTQRADGSGLKNTPACRQPSGRSAARDPLPAELPRA